MPLSALSDHSTRPERESNSRTDLTPPAWLEGGLVVVDGSGGIVEVNPPLAGWLQQPAPVLVGRSLASVLVSCCPGWADAWARLDGEGQTFARATWEIPASDLEPRRRFQVELTRHASGKLFRISSVLPGFEGSWLDVNRQTVVEERLDAATWKETLASLTMGLAHDFRNVMSGILALTETFQLQLEPQHPFQHGLSLLRTNAWQASQSIQRILQLYQGKTGEKSYQDLNELVQEMTDMTRKMLSRRITIESRLADGRLPLYLDAFEFRQAFLNLAVNARDAMPSGGQLAVTTSRHQALPQLNSMRGRLPRLPAICLTISDTGSGISTGHLPSIFDPSFTTKGPGKGSGLGLYNVALFVERHGGAVSVESQEGQGTAFRLWLPEADFTEGER